MIKLSGSIIMVISLFFALSANALTVQNGNDALFFDMMGQGTPSQRAAKAAPPKETVDYKDVAAKLMKGSSDENVKEIWLDELLPRQSLLLPLRKDVRLYLTEMPGQTCSVECNSRTMQLKDKFKEDNRLVFNYTAVAFGKAVFYVDCIQKSSGKVDSKVVIMNVR